MEYVWTKSEYSGDDRSDRISSAKYMVGGASAVSRYRRNPNGFVPTISVGYIGTRADRGLHKSSKKKSCNRLSSELGTTCSSPAGSEGGDSDRAPERKFERRGRR